ncbi:MAG: TonB-dependent receptor [Chitinophagales bacterium]
MKKKLTIRNPNSYAIKKVFLVMKLSFLLVLLGALQVSAFVSGQTAISIRANNTEVAKVLNTIEKQSPYRFLYNSRLKSLQQRVSIDVNNADIGDVLNQLFESTDLTYKLLENNLIVITSKELTDQDIKITGKVTNENGEGLSGVSITVQGATGGTSTDNNGNFTLTVPEKGAIIVSYIGYQTQIVQINSQPVVNIKMVQSSRPLDEVVVIGYGTQKKIDVTGATGTVKGAELVRQPVMTATQAIQGKVAGVQIVSSGQPGSSPQVRIRGTGSILAGADPLYVVDGIITDDISNINTADITSVDVLKDASSTAIYGARAANGVILLTTRQGSGKMKVSYNGNLGIRQAANLVKMANSDQYLAYEKAALGPPINPTAYSTDWYNEILRTAFYQNHNVSVSGGTDKNKYLFSLGYLTDEGIVISNNFNRFTSRLNDEFIVSSKFKIGVFASYSNGIGQNVPLGIIFPDAYRAAPVVPGIVNGKYGNTSQFQNVGNPILDAKRTDDKSIDNRLQGTGYAELKPVPWLTLKTSFGDELGFGDDRQYTYMLPNDTTVFTTNGGSQGPTLSNLSVSSSKFYHWTWDNTITYNQTFDKHHITALAGTTSEKFYASSISASRPNVPPNPNLWYLQTGDQNLQYNGSSANEYTRNSFIGRVLYSYDEKYLITATFRADGSSVFPEQNRWGYFPSIGAGWVINKENFMEHQHIFDYLKLRAGWGRVGNSNIPGDASVPTLLLNQPYYFNGGVVSGSFVPQIKDQNIKWETSVETDLGLEFTTLKGRLSGEIDVYDKKTSDALILVRVPGTFGSQANPNSSITPGYVLTNAASIENKGLEVTLRWNDKINQNISYHVGGNITFNDNNVTGLNGGSPYLDGNINGYFVTETTNGHPIGSYHVRKVLGVFQSKDEVNAYVNKNGNLLQPGAQPGDFKYQFKDNGQLDTVFAGSYQPTAYYGINLGGNYKNIDISIDLYGNFGNKVYNGKRQARVVVTDNIEESMAVNRWTPQNHSQTEPAANGGNLPASTYFVASGNFFRINNITIGYNLSSKILQKQKVMSSLRIFVNSQNPLTIKKYSGFSAELPGTTPTNAGIDLSTYPTTKTFAVGISLGL